MTRTVSIPVARLTHRIALAKACVWTGKRSTQPAQRPAATGGTR